MRDFQLSIERDPGAPLPLRGIDTARGCSTGRSADAAVTVCLLGIEGRGAEATQLADAFAAHGRDVALFGTTPVGAVVLDHASGDVLLVASRIGMQQVYWHAGPTRLGIASDGRHTLAPNESVHLEPAALHRYLYFHMSPGPQTVFAGIQKLDGGHSLRWTARDEPTLHRYWAPQFDDSTTRSEAELTRQLHDLLRSSVADALGDRSDVGAFLSGGLDSSTVAGFAAQARPGIPTVSMGFDAAGYDETEYARIASKHFGTRAFEYYVTPDDVLSTLPAIAAAFPEPFGNSSAAATFQCARIAREHGIGLLLAGDGGDELFGGNERYARQLVFERYANAPKLLRQTLGRAVEAAGAVTTAFPVGKAVSYVRQASVPLPDRLQAYNFLHRHDAQEIFHAGLLAAVDAEQPLSLLRREYAAAGTRNAVNRMLCMDWKFTLHDNDLVKVNWATRLAGVDVAYPMLAPELVEFSQHVPGDWKVRGQELRWFYKRAMRGFLPTAIIDKTKHGFGLPFGVWTRTHEGLRKLSEDALGSLGQRGYFKPAFLAEALRLHRDGHAAYYGELVWILMALELWLREHLPDARL